MEENNSNHLTPRERVEKYDQLLYEIEDNLIEIQNLSQKLKETQKKVNELSEYYNSHWMEDFEAFENEPGLHVLGEDYAYNAFMEFHQEKKEILKLIAESI